MTAKEYLLGISRMDRCIDAKIAESDHLKSMIYKITPTLTPDKVMSSGTVEDRRAECIAKLIDLQKEINDQVDLYADERKKAVQRMERMDNGTYYNVLVMRYVMHSTWEAIAEKLHYTTKGIWCIHGRALVAYEKLMKEDGLV